MSKLLALALALSACGDNIEPPIARVEACDEQALSWCTRAGFAPGGCDLVYTHLWCGAGADIGVDAQITCLEAIEENPKPRALVPTACEATW